MLKSPRSSFFCHFLRLLKRRYLAQVEVSLSFDGPLNGARRVKKYMLNGPNVNYMISEAGWVVFFFFSEKSKFLLLSERQRVWL